MKKRPFHIFQYSIFPILLTLQIASAQQVPVSVRSAIGAALENHASVRMAGEKVKAAEAGYEEAGARLLPKVQLTGRAFLLSDVEQATISLPILPTPITLFPVITHSYAAGVQVTQPVFAGFKLTNAKEAASYRMEAARAEQTRDESSMSLMTERSYWGWVQAREASTVLVDMVAMMKEHESQVQNLADRGLARTTDVLNIRMRRSEIEVKAIEARTMASMAMMRLNSLMGNSLDTELRPEESPIDILQDPSDHSAEELVTRALAARPDLASARFRTEMARSGVAMAQSGWYPSIALAAAYVASNPNQRIIPPKDRFDGSWQVGLTFQWTVWDWMTTSHQTAQAEAAQRQAEAGYQLMLDGTKLEVAQVWRTVEDSRDKLLSAQYALEAAEESFRVMEQQYEQGLAKPVDVTDARVELLRAKLGLSQAAAETAIAKAELRHAIGESP